MKSGASEVRKTKKAASKRKAPSVILASGGKGHTARQTFAAAISQFADPDVRVIERFDVRTVRKAKAVVSEAAKLKAVLLHTFVDPKTRHVIDVESRQRGIPQVDMIGPNAQRAGGSSFVSPQRPRRLVVRIEPRATGSH